MRDDTEYIGNRRIAKNAVMLYIRMFFTMILGLYTSRLVLNVLGVEDFGIYCVVGGVVAMLNFLKASMAGATSRYLTFELGRQNSKRLADTFSSTLIIHIGIALIVLVIAETVGLWFLMNKLVIPERRMTAAHWVYQLTIVSAMFGITQVPYNSTIIAHEKMGVYAYIEIINAVLKLLIIYLLSFTSNVDRLILYAVLALALSIAIRMTYRIYCVMHFEEASFHWVWDKSILKPLLNFSGWDLFGNMAFTFRSQGSNLILNMFYGVVLNAASGVATTVQGVLSGFSSNVILAFKPQIIKTYSVGDFNQMNEKLQYAAKISTILLMLVTVPIFVKCGYVLKLWLNIVPSGAVVMTHFTLLINLVTCLSSIVLIGIHATGKMTRIGPMGGSLYLLSLLMMYLMLRFGLSYKDCYLMFLIVSGVFLFLNISILHVQMPEFATKRFLFSTILPISICLVLSFYCSYMIASCFEDTLLGLLVFVLISVLCSSLLSFVIILNKADRKLSIAFLRKRFHSIL